MFSSIELIIFVVIVNIWRGFTFTPSADDDDVNYSNFSRFSAPYEKLELRFYILLHSE